MSHAKLASTPSVRERVEVFLFDDKNRLLVGEKSFGLVFPGGGADGQPPKKAGDRELREEMGMKAKFRPYVIPPRTTEFTAEGLNSLGKRDDPSKHTTHAKTHFLVGKVTGRDHSLYNSVGDGLRPTAYTIEQVHTELKQRAANPQNVWQPQDQDRLRAFEAMLKKEKLSKRAAVSYCETAALYPMSKEALRRLYPAAAMTATGAGLGAVSTTDPDERARRAAEGGLVGAALGGTLEGVRTIQDHVHRPRLNSVLDKFKPEMERIRAGETVKIKVSPDEVRALNYVHPRRLRSAGIGGVIGAGVGMLAGDDETRGRTALLGGLGGAAIGALDSYRRSGLWNRLK